MGAKRADLAKNAAPHPLKGRKYELNLVLPLPKRFSMNEPANVIELIGPFQEVFGEELEMSDELVAIDYIERRLRAGIMTPLTPAVYGLVNSHPVVVHMTELGKAV